jgi:RNA polymerase sigma-70 factor (ECF subfamily)
LKPRLQAASLPGRPFFSRRALQTGRVASIFRRGNYFRATGIAPRTEQYWSRESEAIQVNTANRTARFQEIAMPHMDAAYNLARWLTGNDHEADDVTQEAFLRAFRFFDGFRGEDARTWILTIVRNTFYTEYRKARGRNESTEFDEEMHSSSDDETLPTIGRGTDTNPVSILARRQDIRLLDQALESLPIEYREALVLRELEDLSYKEIASTMDVPIGTVMSRIARGRGLLLKAFKKLSGDTNELQRSAHQDLRVR